MKKKHLISENKGFAEERALAETLALCNGEKRDGLGSWEAHGAAQ